jgi:hypothetical protein
VAHNLEAGGSDAAPDWDSLYRARGNEVVRHRVVFTGDVFAGIAIAGETAPKSILVVQHPCAIRIDGLTLVPKLLVVEVNPHDLIRPSQWVGKNFRYMPLPELIGSPEADFVAEFSEFHKVTPIELDVTKRIASMSEFGVGLLMQRWMYHNSRVVVPTDDYQEFCAPQFAEAEIMETWVADRAEDGIETEAAILEIDSWLGDKTATGVSARESLQDVRFRSAVRQAVRKHRNALRKAEREDGGADAGQACARSDGRVLP